MDDLTFLYAALALGALLLLYAFREPATDALYLSFSHWKVTVFVLACVAGTLGAGASLSGTIDFSDLSAGYAALAPADGADDGDDSTTLATIEQCKAFVTAEQAHKAGYKAPSPPLRDVLKIGAKSYWDTCAQAFGMNHWKYDLSIGGHDGGQALCGAYRQDSYRSAIVDGWCSTVLAPGKRI